MASSDTDICNLALGHLGEQPITSLSENTVSARACSRYYTATRDQVLRSHRWNFAQARVVLSALAEAPAFGWSHQYSLPADCLRVLEVNDSEVGDVISDSYIIEGRFILTNADAVRLVYTKRVSDVASFDALFVEALSLKLAVNLTEVIRGTTGKTADLLAQYESKTGPLARRVDANEGKRRKGLLPLNSWAERARGGSGGCFGSGGGSSSGGGSGAQGPAGQDGADGLSAYQIAVANGFAGNQAAWLASLVGPPGEDGEDGDGSGSVSWGEITGAINLLPFDNGSQLYSDGDGIIHSTGELRAPTFSGAFVGDGSGITGITAEVDQTLFDSLLATSAGHFNNGVEIDGSLGVDGNITAAGGISGESATIGGFGISTTGSIEGANFTGSSSGTNTGDQDLSGYATIVGLAGFLEDGSVSLSKLVQSGTYTGNVTGNAGTATKWATARTINGLSTDGSANVSGAFTSGTWQGTAVADTYIASATTWNAKQSALTFSTGLTNTGGTITVNAAQTQITSVGTLTGGATGAGFTINFGASTTSGTVPSANLPTASTSVLGAVKVDGSTITISSGVISAAGGTILGTTNQIVNTSGTLSLSSSLVLPGGISGPSNSLEVRNGTSIQNLRLYESYTDASNYSRFEIVNSGGGDWQLAARGAGTGTGSRNIYIMSNNGVYISTLGSIIATFQSSGVTIAPTLTLSASLITTPQALSGAGAINTTTAATAFTSTGAGNALTLANGTSGQIKTVVHVVKGASGTGVLTPTTKAGYTTITFNNAGDSVTLQYHTTAGWCVVGSFGAVIA